MKRFALILTVQFVVMFAAGFLGSWALAKWRGQPAAPLPGLGRMDEAAWFRSQLGVPPEQAAAVESLHRAFVSGQAKICERHCAKRMELAELMKKSEGMSPQMESLTRELSELDAESERMTLQHIFEIGKLLTPAQRDRFISKVCDQISANCRIDMLRLGAGKEMSGGTAATMMTDPH